MRKNARTETSDTRNDEMNGLCVARVQPTKKQSRRNAAVRVHSERIWKAKSLGTRMPVYLNHWDKQGFSFIGLCFPSVESLCDNIFRSPQSEGATSAMNLELR